MVKKRIPAIIKKQVENYIDSLYKDNVSINRVLLFGSWAKGKAHKESDIDPCIISKDFETRDAWDYLWKKRLESNSYYYTANWFYS